MLPFLWVLLLFCLWWRVVLCSFQKVRQMSWFYRFVLVLSINQSFEYAWNCCCPACSAVRTDSITAGSAISFVSKTSKSRHSTSKGFPSSSVTVTSDCTSWGNVFCARGVSSWWRISSLVLRHVFCYSTSMIAMAGSTCTPYMSNILVVDTINQPRYYS